jgi:hypothetical protein
MSIGRPSKTEESCGARFRTFALRPALFRLFL